MHMVIFVSFILYRVLCQLLVVYKTTDHSKGNWKTFDFALKKLFTNRFNVFGGSYLRIQQLVQGGTHLNKNVVQKNCWFFLGWVLVWKCPGSIEFGSYAHSTGARGLQMSNLFPSQKQGTPLCFFAHISLKNRRNFNLRASLEPQIIQVQVPCAKKLISSGNCM
jgi:hypothetical protein